MIAYLPEIYPDELVYSWFCRYYIHTGCITHTMAFRELLYNRCNNPSKEFIGHLNPDTAKLIQRLFVMDDLIIETSYDLTTSKSLYLHGFQSS